MKSKLIFYIFGLLTGILIILLTETFITNGSHYRYLILKEDYKIEGIGTVKHGAKLRIDKRMSEGFTRCILYLNHFDGKTKLYELEGKKVIKPYSLRPIIKE